MSMTFLIMLLCDRATVMDISCYKIFGFIWSHRIHMTDFNHPSVCQPEAVMDILSVLYLFLSFIDTS
jgi:hypothetical protein